MMLKVWKLSNQVNRPWNGPTFVSHRALSYTPLYTVIRCLDAIVDVCLWGAPPREMVLTLAVGWRRLLQGATREDFMVGHNSETAF